MQRDIGDIGAESIGTIAKNPWSAKRSPHRLRVTDFEKGVTISCSLHGEVLVTLVVGKSKGRDGTRLLITTRQNLTISLTIRTCFDQQYLPAFSPSSDDSAQRL